MANFDRADDRRAYLIQQIAVFRCSIVIAASFHQQVGAGLALGPIASGRALPRPSFLSSEEAVSASGLVGML